MHVNLGGNEHADRKHVHTYTHACKEQATEDENGMQIKELTTINKTS